MSIKRAITIIVLMVVFIYIIAIAFASAIKKESRNDCIMWKEWEETRYNHYLTPEQVEFCGELGVDMEI